MPNIAFRLEDSPASFSMHGLQLMSNITFRLEDSGFSRQQIEAPTDFTEGNVASKADMVRLDGKIESVRSELKADIEIAKGELKADMMRLDGKIEHLDGKIESLRSELKTELEGVKGELKADIEIAKGELKADVANVQEQLKITTMMTAATFIAVMTLVLQAFFAGGGAAGG